MAAVGLVVAEFCILAIAIAYMLRHYRSKAVSLDVTVSVYFAWLLGFVGVLLLPLDVSIAVVEDRQSAMLAKVWKFVYWR
jgi:hypothetical protein